MSPSSCRRGARESRRGEKSFGGKRLLRTIFGCDKGEKRVI